METKENYLEMIEFLEKTIKEDEAFGKRITRYCKQYENTEMHAHILLAIEFGYDLKK